MVISWPTVNPELCPNLKEASWGNVNAISWPKVAVVGLVTPPSWHVWQDCHFNVSHPDFVKASMFELVIMELIKLSPGCESNQYVLWYISLQIFPQMQTPRFSAPQNE